jgi:hypothetical protein
MKYLSLLLLATGISATTEAKVWRVNNNVGVVADHATFNSAVNAAAVGDTIYLEPSATNYATGGMTVTRRLVVIGPGYFLNPANTTTPGNAGLQVTTTGATLDNFYLAASAAGSKFVGFTATSINIYASNITFERVSFTQTITLKTGPITDLTIRKCIFYSTNLYADAGIAVSNFICENTLFTGYYHTFLNLPMLTGSGNIVRNNTFIGTGCTVNLVNSYYVNNIVATPSSSQSLTNCTIKNNLFEAAQALPQTATGNKISQPMADVFVGTGSYDGKYQLKAGSPASGAGLSVGAVQNPDCGAFGGTDPYKLSGIPNIPTIYSFTAPTSIPSGTGTMNITFSTRNNN